MAAVDDGAPDRDREQGGQDGPAALGQRLHGLLDPGAGVRPLAAGVGLEQRLLPGGFEERGAAASGGGAAGVAAEEGPVLGGRVRRRGLLQLFLGLLEVRQAAADAHALLADPRGEVLPDLVGALAVAGATEGDRGAEQYLRGQFVGPAAPQQPFVGDGREGVAAAVEMVGAEPLKGFAAGVGVPVAAGDLGQQRRVVVLRRLLQQFRRRGAVEQLVELPPPGRKGSDGSVGLGPGTDAAQDLVAEVVLAADLDEHVLLEIEQRLQDPGGLVPVHFLGVVCCRLELAAGIAVNRQLNRFAVRPRRGALPRGQKADGQNGHERSTPTVHRRVSLGRAPSCPSRMVVIPAAGCNPRTLGGPRAPSHKTIRAGRSNLSAGRLSHPTRVAGMLGPPESATRIPLLQGGDQSC